MTPTLRNDVQLTRQRVLQNYCECPKRGEFWIKCSKKGLLVALFGNKGQENCLQEDGL
jgi:hypothetical protein